MNSSNVHVVSKQTVYPVYQQVKGKSLSPMQKNECPKVLIIGLSFDLSSGSGITLYNLFKQWDKNHLAIASDHIDNNDHRVSANVFQFGYPENKRRFPFHYFQKKTHSGKIISTAPQNTASPAVAHSYHKRFPFLVKYYNLFLHFFGLYHFSRRYTLSAPFVDWVEAFQPDYIYTHANEYDIMELVLALQKKSGLKVATHIMDHYIDTYFNKPGVLYPYWQRKIEHTFSELIRRSAICLSISEAMGEAYASRYHRAFNVFHNTLEVSRWAPYTKKEYAAGHPFTILYAGRITTGTNNCLLDIAAAINELPEKNSIRFHIQTTSHDAVFEKLKKYAFVHIAPPADYEQIPAILSGADLLVIAHNFDAFTQQYFRYSFPTKAPEYMITGTPILLYAPPAIAITQHARKHQWGYIVDMEDRQMLKNALLLFFKDPSLREKYGRASHQFALAHYNAEHMQAAFKQLFVDHNHFSS